MLSLSFAGQNNKPLVFDLYHFNSISISSSFVTGIFVFGLMR